MPMRCLVTRHSLLQTRRRVSSGLDRHVRHATYQSRTSINASTVKSIPSHNKPLHDALQSLFGSRYLEQSSLSLSSKSLETHDPALRVGILALDDAAETSARLLARTLLSDALGEPGSWEERITSSTRPAILRYSDDGATGSKGAEISAPSRFLQQKRLEILVMRVGGEILSPALETGVTAGYSALLRYPLHRAVVVGKGVEGAVKMGESRIGEQHELVGRIIDIESRSNTDTVSTSHSAPESPHAGENILPVDVNAAYNALEAFRRDPSTGPTFNTAWQASNISTAIDFLAPNPRTAIKSHIAHLLASTEAAIDSEHTTTLLAARTATIADAKRDTFQSEISAWSASAHGDLQSSITRIETSAIWRRTHWARLLWAVDDVGLAGDDALRLWLGGAEAHLAYLTGSIHAAGFQDPSTRTTPAKSHSHTHSDEMTGADKLLAQDLAARRASAADNAQIWRIRPWSSAIDLSRREMSASLVPALQRRAQVLLAQTLTTIGATSALGMWWYVAFHGGMYEAGAIAALGLVVALGRVQRAWTSERIGFLDRIMDAGRVVLRQIEGELRTEVREKGRRGLEPEDVKMWDEARAAVRRCRDELEKM